MQTSFQLQFPMRTCVLVLAVLRRLVFGLYKIKMLTQGSAPIQGRYAPSRSGAETEPHPLGKGLTHKLLYPRFETLPLEFHTSQVCVKGSSSGCWHAKRFG